MKYEMTLDDLVDALSKYIEEQVNVRVAEALTEDDDEDLPVEAFDAICPTCFELYGVTNGCGPYGDDEDEDEDEGPTDAELRLIEYEQLTEDAKCLSLVVAEAKSFFENDEIELTDMQRNMAQAIHDANMYMLVGRRGVIELTDEEMRAIIATNLPAVFMGTMLADGNSYDTIADALAEAMEFTGGKNK